MDTPMIGKMLVGALVGGLAGWGLSSVRNCSSQQCSTRANRWFTIVAGAFFGAAVAWYFMMRATSGE